MTCSIEIGGVNGESPDGSGLPTRLVAFVRTQGNCNQVEITVRVTQFGPPLHVSVATPDVNGTAQINIAVEPPILACGFPLWVEARCVSGDDCTASAQVGIDCKGIPNAGPGGGPGGGDDGSWPWPFPPQLFCPLIGRAFTLALLMGVVGLLTGIAMGNAVVSGAAIAVIIAAFGVLAVWRQWCAIPDCYFWGALLWVLKRCLVAGLILTVVFVSVACLLATLVLGVYSGIVTNRMRRSHCLLPSITTPITQLPLW